MFGVNLRFASKESRQTLSGKTLNSLERISRGILGSGEVESWDVTVRTSGMGLDGEGRQVPARNTTGRELDSSI